MATVNQTPAAPPPSAFVYQDRPCLNCGRYGCIPGQMITDSYNNTFCSPDCGWSYLLRPVEHEAAAKAAYDVMRHNQARAHRRTSRRSSKSSRHSSDSKQTSTSSSKSSSSNKKPPRVPPSKSRSDKSEDALLDSGNAMFDFSMMFGME